MFLDWQQGRAGTEDELEEKRGEEEEIDVSMLF